MATHNREWMYNNRTRLAPEFVSGVQEFARVALSKPDVVTIDANGRKCIPCPCQKCANLYRRDVETVKIHLYKHGFCALYGVWHKHGESILEEAINPPSPPPTDQMGDMLRAAAGPSFDWDDDQPTGIAKKILRHASRIGNTSLGRELDRSFEMRKPHHIVGGHASLSVKVGTPIEPKVL